MMGIEEGNLGMRKGNIRSSNLGKENREQECEDGGGGGEYEIQIIRGRGVT
jgi:hypothetical protein